MNIFIKYIKGKQFVCRTHESMDHLRCSSHSLLIIFLTLWAFPSMIGPSRLRPPHPNLYCCMSFADSRSIVVDEWNSIVVIDILCCFGEGLIHALMLLIDQISIGAWLSPQSLLSSFFSNKPWIILWFRDSFLVTFLIPWFTSIYGLVHSWGCWLVPSSLLFGLPPIILLVLHSQLLIFRFPVLSLIFPWLC